MLFTSWVPNAEFQYMLGWFFVGLVGILVGVNIKKVVTGALKDLLLAFKKYMMKYRRLQQKMMAEA